MWALINKNTFKGGAKSNHYGNHGFGGHLDG